MGLKVFPKNKRIVDEELLKSYHSKPCVVCGKIPSDPDHIGTKGAGNGDEETNIWSLCRIHHIEKHHGGLNKFVLKYPQLKDILILKGWKYDDYLGRWTRY